MESDAAKKTIGKFDTLAEELRDDAAFYKQPFSTHLDRIEQKIKNKERLKKQEYRILYSIDLYYPGGVEYEENERRKDMMKKWKSDEEKKQDLAFLFDTTSDRISLTEEEALSGDIRYHYGDLNLESLTSVTGIPILPEEIQGNLNLSGPNTPLSLIHI